MGWNPFYKYYNTFFNELNLTRKENVLRNPKATKNKKVQRIFEETNFEHCRNDEWFLPDLFSFFTDQGKQQVNTQLYCCVMLQVLEIKSVNNGSKSPWRKN